MLDSLQAFTNLPKFDDIQVSNIVFNNLQYPEDLFRCIKDKPWAMWLDSCESNHVDSRFDIIVWQPEFTLVTNDKSTQVSNNLTAQTITSTDDPLTLIQQLIALTFVGNIKSDVAQSVPFCGGAIGYFAYDLGRRFENLPNQAIKDIQQADMAVGIYSHAVIYDRKNNSFQLVAPKDKLPLLKTEIQNLLSSSPATTAFALTSDWQANMTEQAYQEKFAQVQNYLLSGDCYQINLAQRFSAHYSGDEFTAYQHLRKHNKAPFSAFIRLENSAVLSVSPERFLKLSNNKVQTKPIKGTRPRHSDAVIDQQLADELKVATKDRAENLMIVDLLRNDLSKVCVPGSVKVPEIFAIESFPSVHHLVSTVEGELEAGYSATDLLRGAFPGGSITGAPKIRAMEIIDELEPQRRNLYCGSIGYISACGNMDTSITIRTLICENNQIHCWAGGGLVADSNVASEYQETIDKVNKILPILSQL